MIITRRTKPTWNCTAVSWTDREAHVELVELYGEELTAYINRIVGICTTPKN